MGWVVIRVEASQSIGFGHMVRSFTLASELRKEVNVVFFTESEFVVNECEKQKFLCYRCLDDKKGMQKFREEVKNGSIVAIVIDTKNYYPYSIVRSLKTEFQKVFFVENVSRGTIISDAVIFPAPHFNYYHVYKNARFSMPHDKLIFGEDYVLIRNELMNLSVCSGGGVVVTTGASDPAGVMQKLDEVLNNLKIKAHFLIGEKFLKPPLELGKKNGSIYTKYHPRYINKADLIISTFGVSVFEALFLQKPTISIGHNLENSEGSKILSQRTNMIKDLGFYQNIDPVLLEASISSFQNIQQKNGKSPIDGLGAKRLRRIILRK